MEWAGGKTFIHPPPFNKQSSPRNKTAFYIRRKSNVKPFSVHVCRPTSCVPGLSNHKFFRMSLLICLLTGPRGFFFLLLSSYNGSFLSSLGEIISRANIFGHRAIFLSRLTIEISPSGRREPPLNCERALKSNKTARQASRKQNTWRSNFLCPTGEKKNWSVKIACAWYNNNKQRAALQFPAGNKKRVIFRTSQEALIMISLLCSALLSCGRKRALFAPVMMIKCKSGWQKPFSPPSHHFTEQEGAFQRGWSRPSVIIGLKATDGCPTRAYFHPQNVLFFSSFSLAFTTTRKNCGDIHRVSVRGDDAKGRVELFLTSSAD